MVMICLGANMRTKLRNKYNIAGSPCMDCFCWWCCAPCAVCQETATIAKNIGHDNSGPMAYVDKYLAGPGVNQAPPTTDNMTRTRRDFST